MSPDKAQIPAALRSQFRHLERRLWWVDSVTMAGGIALSLLGSFLLVYVSDRLWDTPVAVRLLFTFAGFGAAAWFVWGWMEQWVFSSRDLRGLSGLVQKQFHRLGDRLLGIVELADPARRPGHISPQLCQAAIRQVSQEAAECDFRTAVATRRPRLYLVAALGLLVLALAPGALVPELTWNTLARWFWPASPVERFTFVRLEDLPERLVVAHGEPFEITCQVHFHPFWRPAQASLQVGDQARLDLPIEEGRVIFPVPGQVHPVHLDLAIGDVRRRIEIDPRLRPAMKGMLASVVHPDYLQQTNRTGEVTQGALRFVEGARVAFRGRVSRPLQDAWLSLQAGEDAATVQEPERLPVEGEWFASAARALGREGRASFTWRDQWGLTSAAPWQLSFTAEPDLPPEVECPNQAAAVAILEEEVLEIRAVARDDFGLRNLELAWECRPRQGTNLLASGATPLGEGSPYRQELEGTYSFAPALLDLPADSVVDLTARARDYHPERPPTVAGPYKVYILSYEEHARLIQHELERLMAELEDVTRRQEALKEAGTSLLERDPESLASPEGERQLEAQANEQRALARKLAQVAGNAANTLKEALRNKTIPTDLIEEWSRMAETMQNLASQSMPSAAQQLAQAQTQPAQRAESLQEAVSMEEEVLRELLALQEQIGPALDRLMANTLAQRLRGVAQTEAQIVQILQSLLPETIGLRPENLEPPHRDTVRALASDQDRALLETTRLQDEIRRFFERTREPKYGEVANGMVEAGPTEAMPELVGLIRGNVGATAMQEARKWEQRFLAWAETLEQADLSQGGGGGGEGGGSMSEAALKRLLALLRLRQQELNIRQVTGILEDRRETSRGYREDAILLSIRQNFVVENVEAIESMGPTKFLPQAREAMTEAESLLMKPQTDEPVTAAETDAINLLEAEIMEMMQNAQGSAAAGAMAMMMQMMGMGASPGGNLAGGSTDEAFDPLTGDVRGGRLEERGVEKAAGQSTRVIPAEFRDVLQEYHKAVDELEASLPEPP